MNPLGNSRIKSVQRVTLVLIFVCLLATVSVACNIPVFRYALERWHSDQLELLVFTKQRTLDLENHLAALEQLSTPRGGHTNFSVEIVDLEQASAEQLRTWERLKAQRTPEPDLDLPYCALLGKHIHGQYIGWQGNLNAARQVLAKSPQRRLLADRLLAGDAIVWVIVSGNQTQNDAQFDSELREQLDTLADQVSLPEGIGLPGSELFSDVPLLLRYSVLNVDRNDPREALLVQLCAALQPEAFERGEAIVMPVFGRGRALEAIPRSEISPGLVRDLTQFLCAACSCQVKEQNPGFDLLIDLDWDSNLFGDDGELPPASENGLGLQKKQPKLLKIPPGKK